MSKIGIVPVICPLNWGGGGGGGRIDPKSALALKQCQKPDRKTLLSPSSK